MNGKLEAWKTPHMKGAIFSLFLSVVILASAGFSSSVVAATVGEEFVVSDAYSEGFMVSIKKDSPEDIELTSLNNGEYFVGVVNNSENNSVTYSRSGSSVSVSLLGEVRVFVSDVNGVIEKGDLVGASWLEGVGMKVEGVSDQTVVGVALESFDPSSAKEYGEIDTPDGKKSIAISSILVRLSDKDATSGTESDAGGLYGFADSIAGKNVSVFRALIASLVFLICLALAGFFVSSSIRGSFISLGRNPRASSAIYKGLLRTTLAALAVILLGAAVAYAVLAV